MTPDNGAYDKMLSRAVDALWREFNPGIELPPADVDYYLRGVEAVISVYGSSMRQSYEAGYQVGFRDGQVGFRDGQEYVASPETEASQ